MITTYVDLLDGNLEPTYPTTFFDRCECGALKTWGAGPRAAGHSYWCKWSAFKLKNPDVLSIPHYCELGGCMVPAGVCAVSNGKTPQVLGLPGTVHWYCRQCWGKFVLPPDFSHHWFVSRS